MKSEINVLVVDDNREFTETLKRNIVDYEDIVVGGVARTGLEALEMIKVMQPDAVLLDIILPGIDGMCVLEKAVSGGICPGTSFIVVSSAGHDSIIKKAVRLGADYYMLKPFMIDVLVRRIRQVCHDRARQGKNHLVRSRKWYWQSRNLLTGNGSIDLHIATILHKMGLMPNVIGYYYLLHAVEMIIKNPDLKNSITGLLYPAVAGKFGITPQKVERSIRNAISNAWKKGNTQLRESYREKPTNSELICTIAEWIRVVCII